MKKTILLIAILLLISVNVCAVQQQVCTNGVCADFNVYKDGLRIKLTCTPLNGTFYFDGDISIVQNGEIIGVNDIAPTEDSAKITCAGMSMCFGSVNQGVTLYVTINGFPIWFDINKAFIFYYQSNTFNFDEVVLTTTTTSSIQPTTSTTSIPQNTTSIIPSTTTTTVGDQSCAAETVFDDDMVSIELLRQFRDKVLMQTPRGRESIVLYYQLSPLMVDMIKKDPDLKEKLREYFNKIEPVIRDKILETK